MSLGIKIIDKYTNQILNELDDNNFGVLIDDPIYLIKDKLFVFLGLQYYPNFVKLEIKIGENDYLIISDNNYLDFSLNDNAIIYVSTVFNITEKSNYLDFDLNPYNLYNKIKDNLEYINNLHKLLVTDFVNLTIDDLIVIIKMKMIDYINQPDNETILSINEKETLEKDVQNYFNDIGSQLQTKKRSLLLEQDNLKLFYNQAYSLSNLSQYYDLTKDKDRPLFNYTNVIFSIRDSKYESGILGKFIKLQQIFNTLELSDDIPFMVYNTSKSTPMIKVYNKLIDTVSDNTIKSWILNEKKKLNQVSYKKVKGLLCKYRFKYIRNQIEIDNYLTILLNENGLLTIKIMFNDDDKVQSINYIKSIVESSTNSLIDKLNKLQGIYSVSKRLQSIDMSIIKIESINAFLITNQSISLDKFRRMLTQVEIRQFFEAKETISKEKDKQNDILLMYYKKFGKKQDDIETDKKGITVNIKDNPFKLDSSIITIYGGYNLTQLQTIVNEIFITNTLMQTQKFTTQISTIFDDLESEEEDKKLKEKSNIKILRQRGVKIFSSKCQKPRQPVIDDNLIVEKNRTMIYENNRYICPNDTYPYPGFTPDNIPCCFKFQGKGMAQNIKNTEIFETKVQPSNFSITIEENDGTSFETFVIKIISDMTNGFNMDLPYYYISYSPEDVDFPLKHIHNVDLISKIKQKETEEPLMSMWLETVPLSQLISKPSKSKCQNQPNFDKANQSINTVCEHHPKNNYFGYNINSYPCCFDKERPIFNIKKIKEKDSTKQHILITDKLLNEKRQGLLPPGLNNLLNEIIKQNTNGTFLRWGVNQNELSFLNCILEAIEHKTDSITINNTTELKRYLITYLKNNKNEFEKLNNGTISLKYTFDEYLKEINDNANWKDIIDLLTRVLKCNVFILDVPYIETESTKTFNYNNIKLVCNFYTSIDKTNPFIILIKKQNAFELIVYNTGVKWDKKSQKIEILKDKKIKPIMNFVFNYSSDDTIKTNIINFLLEYNSLSCVKENEYPENYTYDPLYDINNIVKLLNKTPHKINLQLVNSFNKVNYIVTKSKIIIPIKESGIIDLPKDQFEDYIDKNLLNINEYNTSLKNINKLLKTPIKLLAVTTNNQNKINSVMTNFGQFVPLNPIDINQMDQPLEILPIKYYYDIDQFLANKKENINKEVEWNKSIETLNNKIYKIKKYLGQSFLNDNTSKNQIINIIKTPIISRSEKINNIVNYLEEKLNLQNEFDITSPNLQFILKHIANEMINDNIENLLLNNLITSDVFNADEIIKRNNESIWLNLDDIKKWIKKFRTQD
jgi:hypothetical protein